MRDQATKTDNHNLAAKLRLRRHFLDRYHVDGAFSVFDACQGDGVIWKSLAKDYAFDYWGVDQKRRAGRLQVDSERVLALAGLSADVIDIDAYGSPWGHWLALLPNVAASTTVFLTQGMVRMRGGGITAAEVLDVLGLRFSSAKLGPALTNKAIASIAYKYMISQATEHGLVVREIVEALNPGGNARYFGVRLEPSS